MGVILKSRRSKGRRWRHGCGSAVAHVTAARREPKKGEGGPQIVDVASIDAYALQLPGIERWRNPELSRMLPFPYSALVQMAKREKRRSGMTEGARASVSAWELASASRRDAREAHSCGWAWPRDALGAVGCGSLPVLVGWPAWSAGEGTGQAWAAPMLG